MRHLTCDPNLEIIGQAVLGFIENLRADEIQPYLETYGLSSIDPAKWYPAQDYLNFMNALAKESDLTQNLVAIGMTVAENMVTPPELQHAPLGQILMLWNDLYHLQHRGVEDIGRVLTEKVTDTHYTCTQENLYPDDFCYGLAYGMAKRFLPAGSKFKVYYDTDIPTLDQGGTKTVIHVQWS